MIWLIVGVLLFVVVLTIAIARAGSAELPPTDPKALTEADIELHRIRRQLDVAYTKTEQRRDTARLRRDINRVLDDEE